MRENICELIAKHAVEFNRMHDRTVFKESAGQGSIARTDLEHPLSPYFLKIGDAVYCRLIDKEVLVMVRFHFEVKT
jgi:hypothetical protein